jgi:hypothetical protein
MAKVLHLTSGDIAGELLERSGLPGEVFVWHDVLYEGPRRPGWPDEQVLRDRAGFLARATGGALREESVLGMLRGQYARLERSGEDERLVLWFDACLFDQAMLCHLLACLAMVEAGEVELLCLDAFPGIEPFHGLGQLTPARLASVYDRRTPVTAEQVRFARRVDDAFALQDEVELGVLCRMADAPLPWVPAAAGRWLQERPDEQTGLGRLETLALEAIRAGHERPADILRVVADNETPPRYWGDFTLWAKINALADRTPPRVRISGPAARLPQWGEWVDPADYRVYPLD